MTLAEYLELRERPAPRRYATPDRNEDEWAARVLAARRAAIVSLAKDLLVAWHGADDGSSIPPRPMFTALETAEGAVEYAEKWADGGGGMQ